MFTDSELRATHPITGEPEDLCGVCRKAANGMLISKSDEDMQVRSVLDYYPELNIEHSFN
jgi:hypothetical protein